MTDRDRLEQLRTFKGRILDVREVDESTLSAA